MKLLASSILIASLLGLCACLPDHASTIRPPSFPLAVRNPYTNFWLPRNELPGNWPVFWTGKTKGWTGLIRVDRVPYIWMGNPLENGQSIANRATQTSFAVTPTQTIFYLKAGPVDLNVTFFSPVEYNDIRKQSIPLSYVTVNVASNDGAAHATQIYMDISGEWATSDLAQVVTWDRETTPGGLQVWSTQLQAPTQFGEHEDYPKWGRAILATTGSAYYSSGADNFVRQSFVRTGYLLNNYDSNFRCASCNWPTFGFAEDLNEVTTTPKTVEYVVGLVREINANFLGVEQKALWVAYWTTLEQMLDFFWTDLPIAREFADALDSRILHDAYASHELGQPHADILALSLRQAYAGNEFSGNLTHPIYYQKEISSGAFMQTVDVIYPAAPMFYYLDIHYLEMLLEPLFYMMEMGEWTKPFAMHDIGAPYPNGLGQAYGGDMPVEESANMIMMVGDIAFHPTADPVKSRDYILSHYDILSVWADYLHEHCLYPVDQLTTDDFIGPTHLNSGLALKGILGMATFAKLAGFIGNSADETFYNDAVRSFVPTWYNESIHLDGDHLKMEYNVTNGYQFKYNAFHDKLLGLNVVPKEVYQMEAEYYLGKLEPYGIPFVSRHDYTKSDWEMWTAAAFGEESPALRTALVEALEKFLRITPQRVPFTDWYVTATTNQVGFQARPVAGGHFAILALDMAAKHRLSK